MYFESWAEPQSETERFVHSQLCLERGRWLESVTAISGVFIQSTRATMTRSRCSFAVNGNEKRDREE